MYIYFKIGITAIIAFFVSLAVYIPLVLLIEKLQFNGMIILPKWLEIPFILFFFVLVAIFYSIVAGRMRIHQDKSVDESDKSENGAQGMNYC